jgi:hypothetical protein
MKRHTLLFKVTVDTAKDAPITQEQIEAIERAIKPLCSTVKAFKVDNVALSKDEVNIKTVDLPEMEIKDVRFSLNVTADYDEAGMTLKEAVSNG